MGAATRLDHPRLEARSGGARVVGIETSSNELDAVMSSTKLLTLEAEHEAWALYSYRSLLVLIWRRDPKMEDVGQLAPSLDRVLRRNRQPMVMAAVAGARQRPPDAEVRGALQQGIRNLDGKVVAAVNIVLGSGFHAAAMRAVLSGFSLVARQRHPVAFVADAKAASGFILEHWPASDAPPPAQQVLESALAELIQR